MEVMALLALNNNRSSFNCVTFLALDLNQSGTKIERH
jgi:hypothetical protein